MTANKAKEILKLAISDPDLVDTIDLLNAQKLGIEALNFWNRLTDAAGDGFTYLLPGEDAQ